jgi:hypothetical protein
MNKTTYTLIKRKQNVKNMNECDNSKIHISSKFKELISYSVDKFCGTTSWNVIINSLMNISWNS